MADASEAKPKSDEASDTVMAEASDPVDDEDTNNRKLAIFVQCLLYLGSKSYSHVVSVIERYTNLKTHIKTCVANVLLSIVSIFLFCRNLSILHKMCEAHSAQMVVVQQVFSFWRNSEQMVVILLDKLMTYRIVTSTAIIDSLFAEEHRIYYTRYANTMESALILH